MEANQVTISDVDKAVITMTAKLIANKGYNAAEICTLLLNTMAAEQGTSFVEDFIKQSNEFISISGRFLPPA